MQQVVPLQTKNRAVTRELADWIAGFKSSDLPDEVREAIRLAMLDTLGVGLHGIREEWSQMALTWARRGKTAPSERAATVWGEAEPSLSAADAAFVNAIAVHAFELDDFCQKLHPGAVVIPPAIAVGEYLNAPAEKLETAIALGYEAVIRLSRALDPNQARLRGWHLTGVCGPLGGAAACAYLLDLDAEKTAWALGLGTTQGSGLFSFNADGAMSKRFHPGRAAHAGVMAAELAELGFSGPTQGLEAEDGGLLWAISDHSSADRLVDGLGSEWLIERNNFKPYSCCGSVHAYLDAAKQIRNELGGSPSPSDTVRAGLAKVVDVQCGYDYTPGTALNAQMSLRYCLAVALLDGEGLPAQFTEERMNAPDVIELAGRIELVPDAEFDRLYPTHYPAWVEVAAPENAPVRADVLDPSGSPSNPDRTTALLQKYDALMEGVLPKTSAATLRQTVLSPASGDVHGLISALSARDG